MSALLDFISQLPLPMYAFVVPFLEEIINPLPSSFVAVTLGLLAAEQEASFQFIVVIFVISLISKTIASTGVFLLVRKFKDEIFERKKSVLGVSEKDLNAMLKYFDNSRSDELILFLLRAIPIVPTGVVSAASGVLKMSAFTFAWVTFLGLIVRNAFFIYLGYQGITYLEESEGFSMIKIITTGVLGLASLAAFLIAKRKMDQRANKS